MKRFAALVIILVVAGSCYKPGRYPLPLMTQARDYMESFRNYFLEGRLCDAGFAFNQGVDIFARIDDICSVVDAYIQKYLLYAYMGKEKNDALDAAERFASMGDCAIEMKRIEEIRRPAEHEDRMRNIGKTPNDIYTSVMLRKAALQTGKREHIKDALEIDKRNGWTLFIVLDLSALASITDDDAERERIRRKMDFLKKYIQVCDEPRE